MPYRCPCGTEFDPWEQECPRCGGALEIELVRAPVRMACERGHVAFRETNQPHPCPVCNALLQEAPAAQEEPQPTAEARAKADLDAERQKEVLLAEVGMRRLAYALAVRAGFIAMIVSPGLLGSLMPLTGMGFPSQLVLVGRDEIPLCNAGFLLALYLLWEARQIVARRAPSRWILASILATLVLCDFLALIGATGGRRRESIPFPWNVPGVDRRALGDMEWLMTWGAALVLLADWLLLRTLLRSAYGLVFVYGRAEGRLATSRQFADATGEATPWSLQVPLVILGAGCALLTALVLW